LQKRVPSSECPLHRAQRMSFGAAERVAIPTTGAPTINSPSADGAVGAIAVIGADTAGAEGITDGERFT
jgi:hypothetical protein